MIRKETELYEPVKNWLEELGYQVNCEVKHCDVIARKGEELLVVELKNRFSLKLVYQGIRRQEFCSSVYLAVPVEGSRKQPPDLRRIKSLLKRLELGLLLIRFMKSKVRVDVVQHPDSWERPDRIKRRRAIIREIEGRTLEMNQGGQSTREKQFTAYRQKSVRLAWLLSRLIQASPAQLRKLGACPESGTMLRMNVYGWFNHPGRGLYELHENGRKALNDYKVLTDLFETS